MNEEVVKNVSSELASNAIDYGFGKLAISVGFPKIAFLTPLAKGIILGLFENCFNDYKQRVLSISENNKLEKATRIALQTFKELADNDQVEPAIMKIDEAYLNYAFEVAEHATLESIRQSELGKVDIIGRYYGGQFYKGNLDWQDMHQMITMVGMLTFRQLVLIRLIVDGFPSLDKDLYVSNPSACVEINRLLDYGIWKTNGAAFGVNDSGAIQLKQLELTDYAKQVNEALMLERLSRDEIMRTIESLRLSSDGTPQKIVTLDEYMKGRQWGSLKVDNGALIINGGGAEIA